MERASKLLANSLRKVAQKTTAANIRNWCLTYALELEVLLNLEPVSYTNLRSHETPEHIV